jgi:hypothetical protein
MTCFELKPKFKDIDVEQEVYQIDQLDGNETDYGLAVDYLNAEKERIRRGEKRVQPTPVLKPEDKGNGDTAAKITKRTTKTKGKTAMKSED